jgi:hypothetical protein
MDVEAEPRSLLIFGRSRREPFAGTEIEGCGSQLTRDLRKLP